MSRQTPSVWLIVLTILASATAFSQTLNLPPRPTNAPPGSAFKEMIEPLTVPFYSLPNVLRDREIAICGQVLQGNVPNWMRQMKLVTTNEVIKGTNHTVSYYVTPDYFAIGSETNYFLIPMTPLLAQRLADIMGCSLPTPKMVDDIWTKAPCHLDPRPITYTGSEMLTVPIFDQHNTTIRGQRFAVTNTYPLGTLTGGDNKDVVIHNKIYTNFSGPTKPVVIYGWQYTNGVPIQGAVNVHEETYADYSHGIRFVQMKITVDGQTNTITNVLTNPNLAGLLSDDTIYDTNNVIPIPRYTLPAQPPSITVQPAGQTVFSNSTVTFTTFAIGEKTLSYQWKFNGTNLAGQTDTTLIVTNIQASNAGTYTVVINNTAGTATSIPAVLKIRNSPHAVLFADDFETDSSANWDVFFGSSNGIDDYTVDWAFDYSQESTMINGAGYFIPAAPNSIGAGTRGVRLTVNNNDTNKAIAGLNLYLKNKTFSNNFALKFDMWINYPGDAGGSGAVGSTEHAIFGVNHLGTEPNWAATTASSTDGLWFAVDGEGGTTDDYRSYVGNPSGAQTEVSSADNTSALFTNLFPSTRFETAGSPGKSWVEVEVQQVGNVITWLMNGTIVAQRTNTSTFTSGKVMIGFMDVFSSIASPTHPAFVLFDNVRVEDLGQTITPPSITTGPQSLQVSAGTNVTFSVSASGSAPLLYQWFYKNVAINGATNSTLQLTNVQPTNSGNYTVNVSNDAGLASASATLTVISQLPRFASISQDINGQPQLTFTGDAGSSYLLEASTNMISWAPISVLPVSNGPFPFLDPDAINRPLRFYRSHLMGASYLLTDFEAYANGTTALFFSPGTSGSTTNFIDLPAGNYGYVTNSFPAGHGSSNVWMAGWTFKSGTTNPWVRLTTFNAPNIPNPIIGLNQALQFDIYSDHDIYLTIGLRETNPAGAIGSNGGTTGAIEWVGGTTANTSPPKGRLVKAGQWTTLTFFIPNEPVLGFTGNGVLNTTTGKFVLEHLALVPTVFGPHTIYVDNFNLIDLVP